MGRNQTFLGAAALALSLFLPAVARAGTWDITGDLSESCSCRVPCTCNFGEGASPGPCWTIFSLAIDKGTAGTLKLDGLHVGAASGGKGWVGYVDDRATSEQAAALRTIVQDIFRRVLDSDTPPEHGGRGLLGIETVRIDQKVGNLDQSVSFGTAGGFEGSYILGVDGKTPVIVENNTTWNVKRSIKGKSKRLHYTDAYGNQYDLAGTNMNEGKYHWTDRTEVYFK